MFVHDKDHVWKKFNSEKLAFSNVLSLKTSGIFDQIPRFRREVFITKKDSNLNKCTLVKIFINETLRICEKNSWRQMCTVRSWVVIGNYVIFHYRNKINWINKRGLREHSCLWACLPTTDPCRAHHWSPPPGTVILSLWNICAIFSFLLEL